MLPWLQEATRRDRDTVARYSDCESCMQKTPLITRQALGCGYAPRTGLARIWDNPARDPNNDRKLTTCPGYTTKLPEVLETSYARLHWKNSQLETWARGEVVDHQLDAITILEAASQAVESWLLTPKEKGGGRA
jgi:hypothetical protein